MAVNTIFATQNITGFAINSIYGAYWKGLTPSPFELIEGQEYTILWDDIEYTRTAFAFTNPADGTSCVAVGNKMVSTGVNDGDLFAIVNDTTNNYTHLFSIENKTEHSVGIFQVIADVTGSGIILKDINGNEVVYPNEKVMFDTTDGGTQIFSKGEAVENVPITLYLANGDQTITAPDGTLVKSAIILKPENLKPENIKEDVEIAGVIGTHSGGSIKLEDDVLKYIAYQLDDDNQELIVCAIFFNLLYQDTGSYNIHIPDKIGPYAVVINSKGVT